MTRQEFDSKFSTNTGNTMGYNQDILDEINDSVFSLVQNFRKSASRAVANAFKVEFQAAYIREFAG